jgi:hypothetical protein
MPASATSPAHQLLRSPLREQGAEIPGLRRLPAAISQVVFVSLPVSPALVLLRGFGEGKGSKYIRLVKFTNRHADGFALIHRRPFKYYGKVTLYILKLIKRKNGSKCLKFCSG